MSEEISTIESLSTGRSGWARLSATVTARRRRTAGNGYFEAGLMGREAYRF